MKMIRWGILSTAKIAREHVIPAILEADGAQLTAIGSRSIRKATEMAEHFGAPKSYGITSGHAPFPGKRTPGVWRASQPHAAAAPGARW